MLTGIQTTLRVNILCPKSHKKQQEGEADEWEIECIDSSCRKCDAVPLHNITTQMKGFDTCQTDIDSNLKAASLENTNASNAINRIMNQSKHLSTMKTH